MKKLIFLLMMIFSFLCSNISYSKEEYIKGKVLQIEEPISPEEAEEEEVKEVYPMHVLLEGGLDKGKEAIVNFPIYKEDSYNITVKKGDNVVLYYDTEGEDKNYYISDVDKRNSVLAIGIIFVVLVLLIARGKGVKALLSLFLSILFIYKFTIPYIIKGGSPIFAAILTGIFSSVITIYLMTGLNTLCVIASIFASFAIIMIISKFAIIGTISIIALIVALYLMPGYSTKGAVAILGSVGGVVVAGILSFIFVYKMRLTGYVTVDVLNYAALLKNVRIKEIISAGVIVGSMGAVMDVGMSISSALNEIKQNSPDIPAIELLKSGMRMGKDVIGTMINTLILAYLGSSLTANILINLQKDQYPMVRILNFESIVVEILRAMCGSIGILVAVPITAFIASKFYSKK